MIHDSPAVRMLNETVLYGGLLVRRGDMYLDLQKQGVTGPAWMRYGDLPALECEAEYTFNPATGDFHKIGDTVDASDYVPAAPVPGDFEEIADAMEAAIAGPVCPVHGEVHDDRHWWLKPGMSEETAKAICLATNGNGGGGWSREANLDRKSVV